MNFTDFTDVENMLIVLCYTTFHNTSTQNEIQYLTEKVDMIGFPEFFQYLICQTYPNTKLEKLKRPRQYHLQHF